MAPGRLTPTDTTPNAPSEVRYATTDPTEIGQLIFGPIIEEKEINVRLRPLHPGNKRKDLGKIAANYVELRVRYHHPEKERADGWVSDGQRLKLTQPRFIFRISRVKTPLLLVSTSPGGPGGGSFLLAAFSPKYFPGPERPRRP